MTRTNERTNERTVMAAVSAAALSLTARHAKPVFLLWSCLWLGLTLETALSAFRRKMEQHTLAANALLETGMAFPVSRFFLYCLRFLRKTETRQVQPDLEHLYTLTLGVTVAVLVFRHSGRLWLRDSLARKKKARRRWKRAGRKAAYSSNN